MHLRRFPIACLLCAVFLFGLLMIAAPQDTVDREAYARDHVRFLVEQLSQWTKEFPQQFYTAVMKLPDSSKLSPAGKTAAGELGDSIQKLASLSKAKDLMNNVEFRSELDKSLASAKELNQAMASQRFTSALQSDWDQIRSTLNNLARVYKLETVAFLEPPAGGGGRGGRGGRGQAPAAATAVAAGGPGVTGYITDLQCGKRGKGMWTNVECIQRCLRDGDKLVLVTEEGKIYQIANQDKLTEETYGQVVTLIGKTEGEIITVEAVKL
jgi:hypothetical protein